MGDAASQRAPPMCDANQYVAVVMHDKTMLSFWPPDHDVTSVDVSLQDWERWLNAGGHAAPPSALPPGTQRPVTKASLIELAKNDYMADL